MADQLRNVVRQAVQMIANGEYRRLANLTRRRRLSADEMRDAIARYGRTVILPPEHAYSEIDAIQIQGSSPPSWSVRMPLWTHEERRSDLTVEITITELMEDFGIEIDDIHVP